MLAKKRYHAGIADITRDEVEPAHYLRMEKENCRGTPYGENEKEYPPIASSTVIRAGRANQKS